MDEVARVALELPEVTEGERHGNRTWYVGRQGLRLGAAVQQGGHQAVRRPDPAGRADPGRARRGPRREGGGARRAPEAFFTIPHFDGYAAVLIQLPKVAPQALRDAITDGWLACAPPALASEYLKR